MTCEGCASAVKRVLGRVPGVEGVDTDVAAQRVVVRGAAPPAALLDALLKWAAPTKKEVELLAPAPAAGGAAR